MISSIETLNVQGQLNLREDDLSSIDGKSGTSFFESSRQLLDNRTTIALFEQVCIQPSSVLKVETNFSPSDAGPGGSFRKLTDSPAQICSFSSFAAYLNHLSSKAFSIPTSGVFTSGFGPRWSRHHSGIDIANDVGTAIHSSRRGRVVFADRLGAYGLMVEIQHPDGYATRYGHCSEILVQVGEVVSQGDVIARMGNTGRSTGPHLHFEIRSPQGIALDPETFLGGMTLQESV